MRLIDANAIEAKIEKSFRKLIANQNRPDLAAALSYVGDLIVEAPTVDAVEVVRCKDCIHDNMTTCPLCWIENHTMHFINHNSDDFCSCGERRSNG